MKNDDSQPLAQVVLPTQIPDSFSITDIEQITVQAFHILNNFDIPIGIQVAAGQIVPDMPSATQITVAADLNHRRLYYRTMYNVLFIWQFCPECSECREGVVGYIIFVPNGTNGENYIAG